jgi:hypothetical protein
MSALAPRGGRGTGRRVGVASVAAGRRRLGCAGRVGAWARPRRRLLGAAVVVPAFGGMRRDIPDGLHGCAVARGIGFSTNLLDLPLHFRHCRFRHWSHILLPPPHVGCCRPPTIRGKARVHLMRKASILERLTIAILALLLVAGLVLAIRYDIERTAASKPRTAETQSCTRCRRAGVSASTRQRSKHADRTGHDLDRHSPARWRLL